LETIFSFNNESLLNARKLAEEEIVDDELFESLSDVDDELPESLNDCDKSITRLEDILTETEETLILSIDNNMS
ncbi:18444_t:CDS:1, partial [Racocetra fulgida]